MRINYKEFIGRGFEEMYDPQFANNDLLVDFGGKSCKKTDTYVGFMSIVHILENPLHNVIISKRETSMHESTTYPVIWSVIHRMSKVIGYDLSTLFRGRVSPTPAITFLPTGQKIHFEAFNITDANRSSVVNMVGMNTLWIIDEALEKLEGDQSPEEIERWWASFRQNHDSYIRGEYKRSNLRPKTVIIANPWTEINWLTDKLLDDSMQEEEEHLAKYGKQVFQNKNFQMKGAIGLTVIFRNLLLNEFEDKEKIIGAFLEKYLDYQNYKTETLGMRGQLKGGVYGNYLKLIKTPDYPPKEIEFEKYTGGVDYGTITDNTTAFLNGMTSRKQNPLTAQIEAHMDIWTLCGVDIPQDTKLARPEGHDYAQANKILDFYEQASKVYPDIIRKKVVVYVDRTALAFHDILNREAKSRGITWLYFKPSTNLPVKSRIPATKELIGQGRIHFCKDLQGFNGMKSLMHELKRSIYMDSGERKNKHDHCINGWEYSWMDAIVV